MTFLYVGINTVDRFERLCFLCFLLFFECFALEVKVSSAENGFRRQTRGERVLLLFFRFVAVALTDDFDDWSFAKVACVARNMHFRGAPCWLGFPLLLVDLAISDFAISFGLVDDACDSTVLSWS